MKEVSRCNIVRHVTKLLLSYTTLIESGSVRRHLLANHDNSQDQNLHAHEHQRGSNKRRRRLLLWWKSEGKAMLSAMQDQHSAAPQSHPRASASASCESELPRETPQDAELPPSLSREHSMPPSASTAVAILPEEK